MKALEDFQMPSVLEKQEIYSCCLEKVTKSPLEVLAEHSCAADAPVQFQDLTNEELNLLKIFVNSDVLCAFLKQLRKGKCCPIEQVGLAETEDPLNTPSK